MSRRFPRNFDGNARCTLMFPVSVCLRIESKRFVEEETQRKRLGLLQDECVCRACDFAAVQPRWSGRFQRTNVTSNGPRRGRRLSEWEVSESNSVALSPVAPRYSSTTIRLVGS